MATGSPRLRRASRFPLLKWLRKGRVAVILAFAVAVTAITHSDSFREIDMVQRWEGQAHDLRFRLRGTLPPHPDVMIVGIKASSVDQQLHAPYLNDSPALQLMHDNPWPWPRPVYAKVIEKLLDAGAKVVALDVVLAANRDGDDELVAVLKKYPGRVVLAATIQLEDGDSRRVIFQPPNTAFVGAVGNQGVGYVTYPGELDGNHRTYSQRSSELHEAASLKADELGFTEDPSMWKFAPLAVKLFTGITRENEYGLPINFSGPAETYRALPVEHLLVNSIWANDPNYRNGEVFRDKLVFIGPIAEIFHDNMSTPFGTMPGVEVHAQVAASLLRHDRLRWMPGGLLFALGAAFTAVVMLFVLKAESALFKAAAVAAAVLIFWVVTQLAFTKADSLCGVVPAVSSMVAAGTFGILYQFFLEQRDKAQTRRVLERSVNKRIAKVMLANEEMALARRGERRAVAVLFSDIRSFTTWSEKAEPEHLVGQLNEYFETMVTLIEEERSLGNAQKFIGDAILAVWGDTPENRFGAAEDSRRAVASALRMRAALVQLNQGWDSRADRIVISIGIGINHGEVVTGEVGHPERHEFTVLGDGVNFAARLESATKQFHTDCLVGESVEMLSREHFIFREVGFLKVKGKTKPVHIFTPLSERTTPEPEWLAGFHKALALHRSRDFTSAAALFTEVKQRAGGDDFLCGWYLDLGRKYLIEPPREDWDGSETLTEK